MRQHCLLNHCVLAAVVCGTASVKAQILPCRQPRPGSVVTEPQRMRSSNGLLDLSLTYRNARDTNGQEAYCYQSPNGSRSPTLSVKPGDQLVLHLKNSLKHVSSVTNPAMDSMNMVMQSPCADAQITTTSTNLHFHGMDVPPTCGQDDTIHTAISSKPSPFTYRLRIQPDQPPGLYWYHPHLHGSTNAQVSGGASGAILVEGIENANKQLAGMHERIFVIRDQYLIHPDATQTKPGITPPVFHDAEGDIVNTGTHGGKPSRELSINFVPVAWPDYQPAKILSMPNDRQLWRILNASALTFLDLQIISGGKPQSIGVVSLDGVPIDENGLTPDRIFWTDHIFLSPASRAEFIVRGMPMGTQAQFITRGVDTGPAGENDPARPLADIVITDRAPELPALPASLQATHHSEEIWIGNVRPARTRKLYFSERSSDPSRPDSPTVFILTVDGKRPTPFDPHQTEPDIIAQQGDVEDWVIENRSTEAHAFHIHQVHFMLTQWNGVDVDEPFLHDTINVPYWRGPGTPYPSVTLRVDFRDPKTVGTFMYHCHLLEHEDGGMMGILRVLPRTEGRINVGSSIDPTR
jgi:FtsP/CotA-like multicopper oxidase with cupredoxin domain